MDKLIISGSMISNNLDNSVLFLIEQRSIPFKIKDGKIKLSPSRIRLFATYLENIKNDIALVLYAGSSSEELEAQKIILQSEREFSEKLLNTLIKEGQVQLTFSLPILMKVS
jgi:hypothetical protein